MRKIRKGPDRLIGVDRTDAQGRWILEHKARAGRYYAKVAKRVFTDGPTTVTCKGARSETLRIR